ncbi:MAG: hypothetical protein JWQ35_1219 [Bacteriovoracaceae bacterium]|nr:hypothetical protein [Bacteriovoracaceae bacterium]
MQDVKHAQNFLGRGRFFLIGISIKGIDGLLEFIGGILLLFFSPTALNHLLFLLTREELTENPQGFIANYILRFGQHLSSHSKTFASIYLIGHGLVKLVLVIGLFQNRVWSYPAAIILLSGFVGYQCFWLITHFSVLLAVFTILDVIIIALIWSEYRREIKVC